MNFKRKTKDLQHALELANAFAKGMDTNSLLQLIESSKKNISGITEIQEQSSKPKKGETKHISLQLFKEGNKIPDIAKMRGLTVGTIESHLISFIATGEIVIEQLLSKNKMEIILEEIQKHPEANSSLIKEKLGDGFSYNDIKAVFTWKKMREENNPVQQ